MLLRGQEERILQGFHGFELDRETWSAPELGPGNDVETLHLERRE